MTLQAQRDSLTARYRAAVASRRHKLAERLHLRLVAITTALLVAGL